MITENATTILFTAVKIRNTLVYIHTKKVPLKRAYLDKKKIKFLILQGSIAFKKNCNFEILTKIPDLGISNK